MEALKRFPVITATLLILIGGVVGYLIGSQESVQRATVKVGAKSKTTSPARQFARGLAEQTGLAFPVALAWTKVEGGKQNNFLNVIPLQISGQIDPRRAGRITGRWIQSKRLLPPAKSPRGQIRVIARSGWSAFPKYQSLLQMAYRSTKK